jgi:hypothetical protein
VGHHPGLDREPVGACPSGGQQGELVDRQRPRGLGRRHEGDTQGRSGVQALERVPHAYGIGLAAEGERPRHGLLSGGAERQHECVVGQRLAVGVDTMAGPVDGAHGRVDEPEAALGGQAGEREPLWRRESERLCDCERPVHERLGRREQRDANTLAGEPLEGQRGLDRGGSAAGDQHVPGFEHEGNVGAPGRPAIRGVPSRPLRVSHTRALCRPTSSSPVAGLRPWRAAGYLENLDEQLGTVRGLPVSARVGCRGACSV